VPSPLEPTDVSNLLDLLRREPAICTSCTSARLSLTLARTLDAVVDLSNLIAVDQEVRQCPICGRTQWVLSLPV